MEATDTILDYKIALLTGGWSDEREIALNSAQGCLKALTQAGFKHVDLMDVAEPGFAGRLEQGHYDVAFIAMHGVYGEDGCIQGMLEIMHIPYTFSNVLASARATEKSVAKQAYVAAGIPVPAGRELDATQAADPAVLDALVDELGLPLFVKPASNGSSYGITRVTEREQLAGALEHALVKDTHALVEECVTGTEITVPVLGNEDACALPIIEIDTGAEFYDLKVKYEPAALHHVIPARLPEDVYARAQELAVKAHKALGCAGASRSDFIVTAEGKPVILETNTIPGMTETSLFPDSARHAGIEFPELCRRLIELALAR